MLSNSAATRRAFSPGSESPESSCRVDGKGRHIKYKYYFDA